MFCVPEDPNAMRVMPELVAQWPSTFRDWSIWTLIDYNKLVLEKIGFKSEKTVTTSVFFSPMQESKPDVFRLNALLQL